MKSKILTVIAILITNLNIGFNMANAETLFRDDFNSPILDSSWEIIREDPANWSLTEVPGSLQIISQTGEFFLSPSPANVFVVDPGATFDYIETLLTFNPLADFQQAGPIIYVDDTNYMKFDHIWASNLPGNDVLEFYDRFTDVRRTVQVNADTLYLRITKADNNYTASYSNNGINYVDVGTITSTTLVNPKVGVFAMNGNRSSPEIPANFDYFSIISFTKYSCSGFASPFATALTIKNKAKGTVPAKMWLFDEDGYEITGADVISPPVATVIYNGFVYGDGTTDDAALEPVGKSNDGNTFKYNEDSGYWEYRVSMKQFPAAGTYTVEARSGDFTEYMINPTCSQFITRQP